MNLRLSTVVLAIVGGTLVTAPVANAQPPGSTPAAGVTAGRFVYQGDAYGSLARLGSTVTSGKSAPVVIGCSAGAGEHKSNSTAGVDASPLVKTGAVATTADTSSAPTAMSATSTVAGVNLLSGLITATTVKSATETSRTGGAFSTSDDGTQFVGLKIAGLPVNGDIAPNTGINLVGFGKVVLNEQIESVHSRKASLTVNALHVVISQANALGIPVGTNVVVAHATSGLTGPLVATVDGYAYGTKLKAGDLLSSGPTFRVVLGCSGTKGKVKENGGAGISLPGILNTGAITNTAMGDTRHGQATAETTSTVADAEVLSTLVQATAITADAHAMADSGGTSFSDNGSSFATLSVLNFPEIGPDTPANTKLRIAGLGTLWIHRVIQKGNSIEVRMLELIIRHDNGLGLPIGADLQVAVAHAGVTP